MSSRADTLLGAVSKSSRIIEIGPCFDPIAPKSKGWNSASIDHLTREGLAAKYETHPGIDVSLIEPVDFVWTGGMLSDAVPPEQHGQFDVFLASHVIEHTPDLIAFLDAAQTLLKQDGVVILAVPDKRFCFDYFQPPTTTGQVLQASARHRTQHSGERAFDHFAYAVTDGGSEAWGQRPSQGLRLIHRLEDAAQEYSGYENSPHYRDLHAWHFVPSSFELLLLELGRLGETDWQVERVKATAGWEFFAWLRRGAGARIGSMSAEELDRQRVALLKRSLLETQAQIDYLLASEPELATEQSGLSIWATPMKYQAATAALEQCQDRLVATETRLLATETLYATAMQRIAALEASTSWRATAPFRSFLDRMRRTAGASFRAAK
jgi:SAM-dependent methyltransferase